MQDWYLWWNLFFFVEFNLFIEIKTLSIICDIICFNFVHFTSVLKNSI